MAAAEAGGLGALAAGPTPHTRAHALRRRLRLSLGAMAQKGGLCRGEVAAVERAQLGFSRLTLTGLARAADLEIEHLCAYLDGEIDIEEAMALRSCPPSGARLCLHAVSSPLPTRDMDMAEDFAECLSMLMCSRRLNVAEFAAKVGVASSTLNTWELHGARPTATSFRAIVERLALAPNEARKLRECWLAIPARRLRPAGSR